MSWIEIGIAAAVVLLAVISTTLERIERRLRAINTSLENNHS